MVARQYGMDFCNLIFDRPNHIHVALQCKQDLFVNRDMPSCTGSTKIVFEGCDDWFHEWRIVLLDDVLWQKNITAGLNQVSSDNANLCQGKIGVLHHCFLSDRI